MARQSFEGLTIRRDDAVPSTTPAPTAGTDGILIWPARGVRRARIHLHLEKTSGSGTRAARVVVWGRRSKMHTVDALGEVTEIASTDAWFELFDTGELSEGTDYNRSYLLEGATDFERIETEVRTNGGGPPNSVTTAFMFSRVDTIPSQA